MDVKSRKRVARKVGGVQESWPGSCSERYATPKAGCSGAPTWLAFETKNGFKIVERKALVKVINKHVKIHVKVNKPEDVLYKVYTRKGRPNEITRIKTSDPAPILWDERDGQPKTA